MLKICALSGSPVEISSGGDEADRTSQAELECEIEGSATIGRVSQKLTPLAAKSTKHALHRLSSGVKPAPFNHTLAVFFLIVLPEIHKFQHRATPAFSMRQDSPLQLPLFGHF
jgi:methionyl-tRNA formyltransferase